MKELKILGTGVHALEMVEIIERVNRLSPTGSFYAIQPNDA